jgi:hypothetical protein
MNGEHTAGAGLLSIISSISFMISSVNFGKRSNASNQPNPKSKGANLDIHSNLFRFTGPSNNRRNIRILQAPSQSKGGGTPANLFGHLGEFPDLLDLGLSGVGLEFVAETFHEGIIFDGETGIIGDTIVVFPGEEARGKGGPDRGAVAVDFVERGVFLFEAIAGEKVVLRLISDGGNQIEFGCNVVGMLHTIVRHCDVGVNVPRFQKQTTQKSPNTRPDHSG